MLIPNIVILFVASHIQHVIKTGTASENFPSASSKSIEYKMLQLTAIIHKVIIETLIITEASYSESLSFLCKHEFAAPFDTSNPIAIVAIERQAWVSLFGKFHNHPLLIVALELQGFLIID